MLRLRPRHPQAYDLVASACFQMGRLDEAIQAVDRLIHLDPRAAEHRYKMGLLHQHRGDVPAAMAAYTLALEMDPEGEVGRCAWEAIEDLDQAQVEQILIRAAEDAVFRTKLCRDLADAVRGYGYRLSDAALEALAHIDFDSSPGDDAPPRVH
jgi:tetratricopeptide (TPR) repeat protein